MLLNGEGVPGNRSAAFTWFLRAANAGDAEGRNMVGRCFENGWGVGKDPSEAAVWFGAAAGQGHAWARYNLGHLYLDGLGVTLDRDRAFALYRQAAEAGHVRAMNLVAAAWRKDGASRLIRSTPRTGIDARPKAAIFEANITTPPCWRGPETRARPRPGSSAGWPARRLRRGW